MAVDDEVELFFEHSQNQLQVKAKIKYITPTDKPIVNGKVETEYFLTDMAVLEVSEINDIAPLILGESSTVINLDEVILIGYPNGDYSITKGNINSQKYQDVDLFKLDATSNPGNSGGPCILKIDNTVIGILVGGSTIAKQGENIALKIDDVKSILDKEGISY
jgi:S1-C subfamily serine protease